MLKVFIAVLAAGIFALVAVQLFSFQRMAGLESRIGDLKVENAKARESVKAEFEKERERLAQETATAQKKIEEMGEELTKARKIAGSAAGKVRKDADKLVKELEEKLSTSQQKLEQQQAQATAQINEIKEAADTNKTKISEVTSDVGVVRSEVASTKTELSRTITDLRKTVGDLGVMSGLIATNSKEIAALRAVGDRNYYEFTLPRGKQPQPVGDVQLTLKKSDAGRSRYTLEVLANDKKIQKKDKTANEPVQFYVANLRQPHEIVINEVSKDKISGYLATPKAKEPR